MIDTDFQPLVDAASWWLLSQAALPVIWSLFGMGFIVIGAIALWCFVRFVGTEK